MKTLKILLVIVLSALLMAPAANAATKKERSQAKTIKTLKRQNATLKRQLASEKKKVVASNGAVATLSGQVNTLNGQLGSLRSSATTLNGQVATLSGQVAALTTQRDSVTTENASLRGTLTQGVIALAKRDNMAELRDVVLKPAHDNWVCGGYFNFGTYDMTYTFDGRYMSDGTCT